MLVFALTEKRSHWGKGFQQNLPGYYVEKRLQVNN